MTALISHERQWKRKEMHCSGNVSFGREMLGFAEVWSSKEMKGIGMAKKRNAK